jgi:hypothetical protein
MDINLEVVAVGPKGVVHAESGWQPLDVEGDGVVDGLNLSLELTLGPTGDKPVMVPMSVKVSFREQGSGV